MSVVCRNVHCQHLFWWLWCENALFSLFFNKRSYYVYTLTTFVFHVISFWRGFAKNWYVECIWNTAFLLLSDASAWRLPFSFEPECPLRVSHLKALFFFSSVFHTLFPSILAQLYRNGRQDVQPLFQLYRCSPCPALHAATLPRVLAACACLWMYVCVHAGGSVSLSQFSILFFLLSAPVGILSPMRLLFTILLHTHTHTHTQTDRHMHAHECSISVKKSLEFRPCAALWGRDFLLCTWPRAI